MLKGSSLNNVRVNYTKGIELHQMLYIKTAFLQGYKIIGKLMLCLQQKQTQMFSNSRNVSMV